MDREDLKAYLPHRDSMLLLDESELIDGVAYGKKTITGREFFLDGHFPGHPVVPGVILCEIMGQSMCLCLPREEDGNPPLIFFTGIDKARFRRAVVPGDTLETKGSITKQRGPYYWAHCDGYVDGQLCVSADFSFVVQKRGEQK